MVYFLEFEIFQYALLWATVFLCFGAYTFTKKRRFNLPPGPIGLPILGIAPFLGKNPHLQLMKLGKKYGDVFSIYLGKNYIVVINDAATAKQILPKASTADRPPHLFEMVPGGGGFAERNGTEWLEQRRYTMMEMKNLGLGKSNWEDLVHMEVSEMLEVMAQYQGKPLNIQKLLLASTSNNIISLVTNHRLPMGHPERDVIDHGVEAFETLYSQSGLITNFPKLFKFAVNIGLLKVEDKLEKMEDTNKYLREQVAKSKENQGGDSYIDKYLVEIEKNQRMNLKNTFNEYNLVGNCQALIAAGSETTYVSVYWLLLAMASFPAIQRKVHEEIHNVLGKDGSADWVERNRLPYCVATIMEGQRWRTVVPLSILHRTNEDMVVNGYDIPKGTNLMTNLWAFHYDTKNWKDPDMFQPERFLSDDEKSIKEQEAYLPFSVGKRICPGKTVAYIELFHYFVGIMQKFQVLPESEKKISNLEGFPGLTLRPKDQPLRFIPR